VTLYHTVCNPLCLCLQRCVPQKLIGVNEYKESALLRVD